MDLTLYIVLSLKSDYTVFFIHKCCIYLLTLPKEAGLPPLHCNADCHHLPPVIHQIVCECWKFKWR